MIKKTVKKAAKKATVKSKAVARVKCAKTPLDKMNDAELDVLYKTVAEGIERLKRQSEPSMGRARILYYALAGYLNERGIVADMAAMAEWMSEQT